jgi:N-acetyl-D-muramate 6-phosphate phosphatase
MRTPPVVDAVLFDLDGTLIDSAPGLTAASNAMRATRGLPPLPHHLLRPHAGSGARGMLGAAFQVLPGHDQYEALREEFYQHYETHLMHQTRLFDRVQEMLQRLDQHGVPWGIVTNKALRFAQPTVQALGLMQRASALIAGDSTAHTKPHPEPLLEAARRMQQEPPRCVYVGDDVRDMRAGKAAGMFTLAAAWGYLGVETSIQDWGADQVLAQPDELLNWLDLP